jgi:hypothetical protein
MLPGLFHCVARAGLLGSSQEVVVIDSEKKIIVPSYIPSLSGPLLFLIGPIQGAPDWQSNAITLIHAKDPSLWVASPRSAMPKEVPYDDQVDWEHAHLTRACAQGALLVWLAKEETHRCDRAYAQTSRFELGWHFCEAKYGHAKMVVGIESGFTNERYIRKTLKKLTPWVEIVTTLEETCSRAVDLAHAR